MKSPFNEAQEHRIRQICRDMVQSPQGRDYFRPLLKEIHAKDGDYVSVKKRLLDILGDTINSLYVSEKPVVSRQTYGDR